MMKMIFKLLLQNGHQEEGVKLQLEKVVLRTDPVFCLFKDRHLSMIMKEKMWFFLYILRKEIVR